MLKVVGQDIISGAMGFIGTDSDRLYRMGAAEKTEDVTVTETLPCWIMPRENRSGICISTAGVRRMAHQLRMHLFRL